jgi:hypothetical protein
LQWGSPGINSGNDGVYLTNTGLSNFTNEPDITGGPRRVGLSIDRGAYEDQALFLEPYNDTLSVMGTTLLNVLANDSYSSFCNPPTIVIATPPASGGTASVQNGYIRYTPPAAFYGVDSLDYYITCDGYISDRARVYILVSKPVAQRYIACPGVAVTMGFVPTVGIVYNWYNVVGGGAPIYSATATISVVKTGLATETWWVEPVVSGFVFPRIRVDLEGSANCGGTGPTTGCMAEGTILFKEDFGGNNVNELDPSSVPLPEGTTNYDFRDIPLGSGETVPNQYMLIKQYAGGSVWHAYDDHTVAGVNRGYMMLVDADITQGLFYTKTIAGLCENTTLYFSVWVGNLMRPDAYGGGIRPILRFVLQDADTDEILVEYGTGEIPVENQAVWKLYGFSFTSPTAHTLKLSIYNNAAGGVGNDLVLDDIEVRFCAPEVSTASSLVRVCQGSPVTLSGHYEDNTTFGNNLVARWEYSPSGIMPVSGTGDWAVVPGTTRYSTDGTEDGIYTIAGAALSDAGYYRMVVGTAAGIDNYNCRAMSQVIQLLVDSIPAAPVIAPVTDVCQGEEIFFSVPAIYAAYEWRAGSSSGAVSGALPYLIATAAGTHTYVARVRNDFGCWSDWSAPVTGVITAAQSSLPVVTVTTLSVNDAATPPTVTFSVSWPVGAHDCKHLSDVWVFIDYQPVVNGVPGSWSRALVNGVPGLLSTDAGSSLTQVPGNQQGFWLHGPDGAYSATLTVPVSVSSKFAWCAYTTNYPPNAIPNNGFYDLRGTVPFVVNDVQLGAGVRTYAGGCIQSLTDATGAPGLLPAEPVITSASAAPATISVGESTTLRVTATNATLYSFDNGSTWSEKSYKEVTPSGTTSYPVQVKSRAGCVKQVNITVTVN